MSWASSLRQPQNGLKNMEQFTGNPPYSIPPYSVGSVEPRWPRLWSKANCRRRVGYLRAKPQSVGDHRFRLSWWGGEGLTSTARSQFGNWIRSVATATPSCTAQATRAALVGAGRPPPGRAQVGVDVVSREVRCIGRRRVPRSTTIALGVVGGAERDRSASGCDAGAPTLFYV
jgi:hypothetical protein